MKNKISVIMPIYNIECIQKNFLTAINSILNQTYKNIELILVNDGSKDKTKIILENERRRDKGIKIIEKENGGVESARREGLKYVTGKFIMHMDQDDILDKNAIKILYDEIIKTQADVVVAESVRFILFPKMKKHKEEKKEKIIEHKEFMEDYYQSFFGISYFPVNIWNKLFRKSFLENIPEPPRTGLINEDLVYNMFVLPYAKRIVWINDKTYFYRWGGFTSKYDSTILETALSCYKLKKQQIQKYDKKNFIHSTAIELLNYINTYFYENVLYLKMNKEDFVKECQKVLKIKEVQEAIKILKHYDKYHTKSTDAIVDENEEKIYENQLAEIKKNRKKNLFKKIGFYLTKI